MSLNEIREMLPPPPSQVSSSYVVRWSWVRDGRLTLQPVRITTWHTDQGKVGLWWRATGEEGTS